MRFLLLTTVCVLSGSLGLSSPSLARSDVASLQASSPVARSDAASLQATPTVAWLNGQLDVDTGGVMGRSDIVSTEPSDGPPDAMALSNGALGAAVYNRGAPTDYDCGGACPGPAYDAANVGYLAQLNRGDTYPDGRSAGQIIIPSLGTLATATPFQGRLSLMRSELVQSAGGVRVASYVDANVDRFVIEVSGVDPNADQTVIVRLWAKSPDQGIIYGGNSTAPRSPVSFAQDGVAGLSETFQSQGQTFGFATAATAVGRNLQVSASPYTAVLNFKPRTDGTYRVVVAVPKFTGGDPLAAATPILTPALTGTATALEQPHLDWWDNFWSASHFQIDNPDPQAAYLQTLYNLGLYYARGVSGTPASSAWGGGGGPFRSNRDEVLWGANFWHYNTRNIFFPVLAANHPELTKAYFDQYIDNLSVFRARTVAQNWSGVSSGVCVAESIFFNGVSRGGCTNSTGITSRILSSGPEAAYSMWGYYQSTGDSAFLSRAYPFMKAVAQFHLEYSAVGADGERHIAPANGLETYWDVTDPVTDVAAMRQLFPAVAEAATILGVDTALRTALTQAVTELPEWYRDPKRLNVVAAAKEYSAPSHNLQNVELEAVFPWGLAGDSGNAETELFARTYAERKFPMTDTSGISWTNDDIIAARLGRGDDARHALLAGVQKTQSYYGNGMGNYGGYPQFEWNTLTTTALQEMTVQGYDDLIRVVPAWPTTTPWSGSFSLRAGDGFIVSSQVVDGVPLYAGIKSLLGKPLKVRNPWPGTSARLRTDGGTVLATGSGSTLEANTTTGTSYVLERVATPLSSYAFAPISATQNQAVRAFGSARLGVGAIAARPDLAIAATDITTSTPSPGTTRVSVQVKNPGTAASVASSVQISDDTYEPNILGSVPVAAIPPGGSATVTFDWLSGVLDDDVYTLRAEANPARSQDEAQWTNNAATLAVPIGAGFGTASADSTYSSLYPSSSALDKNLNTFWSSANTAMPHWVQADLETTAEVSRVVVRARRLDGLVIRDVDVSTARACGALALRASKRGNTGEDVVIDLATPVAADKVRVTVLAETLNGTARQIADIAEIDMYDSGGNPITSKRARTSRDSTWYPYRSADLIDGNFSTFWSSGNSAMPHWSQVRLQDTAQVAKVVVRARRLTGLVLKDVDISTALAYDPLELRASVRNNTNQDLVVTLPTPVNANDVRVTVLAETLSGVTRQVADIAEIELYDTNGRPILLAPPTPSADSTYGSLYPAGKTVDGDLATFWSSGNTAMPHWTQLDLRRTTEVSRVVIKARRLAGLILKDIDVSTESGCGALTLRASVRSNTSQDVTIDFPQPISAERIRVTVLAETLNGSPRQIADIAEIEAYDSNGLRVG